MGPGSSRVLDDLSSYLSLIFKHSDTKVDIKKESIVYQYLGGAVSVVPPPGSATELLWMYRVYWKSNTLLM